MYEVNIYNENNLIFSESTNEWNKTILQFLVQVPLPQKPWSTFEWWVWSNDVEVDPSMTVAQASTYLWSNTINIYAYFIPLEEIECIIFNWVEFWFRVDKNGLAKVAETNRYEDLDWLPEIPEVNDATLTIRQEWVVKWTFSANSDLNVDINLRSVAWYFENITYTKYTLWMLTEFIADGITYNVDYDHWRVKSIVGGWYRYDVVYSGKYLVSVTKSEDTSDLVGPGDLQPPVNPILF